PASPPTPHAAVRRRVPGRSSAVDAGHAGSRRRRADGRRGGTVRTGDRRARAKPCQRRDCSRRRRDRPRILGNRQNCHVNLAIFVQPGLETLPAIGTARL
ncbi:hypothetical protein DFQ30_005220, partial [Apophysomyces sp. BC1015]